MFNNPQYNSAKVMLITLVAVGIGGFAIYAQHNDTSNRGQVFQQVPPIQPQLSVIPVSSCGTISTPGNYTLTQNISTSSGACVSITNTSNVTLDCANLVIGNNSSAYPSAIYIAYSSNVVVHGCSIHGTINENYSTGVVFDSNYVTVLNPTGIISSVFGFYHGSSNKIINNVIDGGAAGDRSTEIGADDGIVPQAESSDTISNNTISNVFDCGIETAQHLNNSTINGNTVTNAGECGIGGWYGLTLEGDTFSNNTLNNTFSPFQFYNASGLSNDNFYFQNNIFTGNTFTNPKPGTAWTPGGHSSEFTLLSNSAITNSHIGNNTFSNNNFGTGMAPLFWPVGIATDGGGNICGPVTSTPPTYMYGDGLYPLACPGKYHVHSQSQDPNIPFNQPLVDFVSPNL